MSIKSHLKKDEELKLFQVRISSQIYNQLIAKLKREDIQYRNFLEAAAKSFLEEK